MNGVDATVVSLVVLSMVVGVFRGFIREVLSLCNWCIASYTAWIFYPKLSPLLANWTPNETFRGLASAGAIFVVMLFLGALVAYSIGCVIRRMGLSGTDRSLGLFFGMARGVAMSVVGLLVASYSPLSGSKVWRQAMLLPYAKPAMHWLDGKIQNEMKVAKDSFEGPISLSENAIGGEGPSIVDLARMEALDQEQRGDGTVLID